MTGPISRSADHMYTYEGQVYRGVTGVLDVVDKSGPLMHWAAKQTAEAAVDMAIAGGGLETLLATVGREGTIQALTLRKNWKKDEAAKLGTEVHRLADLVVRGEPTPPMDAVTRTRVLGYAAWWKASGWTLRLSEAMLVNPTCGYGGTLDLLCYDADGRTVLADIKTGGKWGRKAYETEILQLTAYAGAEYIQPAVDNLLIDEQKVYPMPKVDRHVILHVAAEGVHDIDVSVGTHEWIAWIACLDLAGWRDSVKGKRL